MAIRHVKEQIPADQLNMPGLDLTRTIFFTHYIFDDTVGIHVCDLRPSYEFVVIGHSWGFADGYEPTDKMRDFLDELCMQMTSEAEVSEYRYCCSVKLDFFEVLWPSYEAGLPDGFEMPEASPDNMPPWEVYEELASQARSKVMETVL